MKSNRRKKTKKPILKSCQIMVDTMVLFLAVVSVSSFFFFLAGSPYFNQVVFVGVLGEI